MRAPGGASTSERKLVALLFADIVGSTSLAEATDPEIVQALISRIFEGLKAEIERYGGTVEKFIGDGVFAVFGIPRAHEDDAERAIRAAMGMQARMSRLGQELRSEGRPEVAIRIGVESGEVLVDLAAAMRDRERMVTGDAVNVAARLQQAAPPGGVVIGPGAHESAESVAEYESLEPLALKGKASPVDAWLVRGLRSPDDHDADAGAAPISPFVGREGELQALTSILDGAAATRAPTLVTVIGEAGIGKSRLRAELERRTAGHRWLIGRSTPYGDVSYGALVKAATSSTARNPPAAGTPPGRRRSRTPTNSGTASTAMSTPTATKLAPVAEPSASVVRRKRKAAASAPRYPTPDPMPDSRPRARCTAFSRRGSCTTTRSAPSSWCGPSLRPRRSASRLPMR